MLVELVSFGATFAITQTIAAVGFPVFIFALIPVRALLMPRLFTPQELEILDAPTASPFTMESVGGSYGGAADEEADEGGFVGGSTDASTGVLAGGKEAGNGGERLAEEGRTAGFEKEKESEGLNHRTLGSRAIGDAER